MKSKYICIHNTKLRCVCKPSLGFSLIEVMVVVGIIGILAALAAPSFTELLRNNRLSGASSALQVSLSLARSEAIKRGFDAKVTVAANTTAGAWTNGWTVFEDKTTNANGQVGLAANGAAGTILEIVSAPSSPISSTQSLSTITSFTYNGQGRLMDPATGVAGVTNRSFWFFDSASQKYCLVANNSGRVRVARVDSSATCPSDIN